MSKLPLLKVRTRKSTTTETPELVNHPAHYKVGGFEVIDIIEAYDLGFCDGNAIKYLLRKGRKIGVEALLDLKKARWYIDRMITNEERVVELIRGLDSRKAVRPTKGNKSRKRR